MIVTIVHVQVKTGHVEDFIQASVRNHLASVQEDGNQRFDVLQSATDPCQFVLYEAYASAEAAAAHKNTAHYREWRDSVADWMAEPRRGVTWHAIAPQVSAAHTAAAAGHPGA